MAGTRVSAWGLSVVVSVCGLAATARAQVEVERSEGPPARFVGHRVVRVDIRSTRDLQTALALTDDVWTESIRRGGPVDIRVSPEQFVALTASGLKFKILINDVQAEIDRESNEVRRGGAGAAGGGADDAAWYTNYHNYADNKTYIQNLAAAYPGIASYSVIGLSLQNREIFALHITGPGSPANRPASVWIGGQHVREWINIPVPEYHAEKLLTGYATDPHIKYLVDNHEFWFIPTMNPDGYDYTWTTNRMWRKNRRPNTNNPGPGCSTNPGVDLNRNWGDHFGSLPQGGSSGTCSNETYRGIAAFSEPETQVIRDFIIANPRTAAVMDWHSYSQLVMSPWGYDNVPVTPASKAQEFLDLDNGMAAAIFATHGMVYDAGPIYTTIYPANGTSVDWVWGARGALGLTIELRDTGANGFTLPTNQITPTCEETWAAFLVVVNHITPCYANCDSSSTAPILNANDFQCFLNAFASGQSYANCDASSVAPTLNANDFQCFLNAFAAGCP